MKRFILLLMLFPFFSYSQNKGDNIIVIKSPVSINTIKSVLFENGYTLIGNDSIYLTTSSKELSKIAISLKMLIVKSDTATTIKGLYRSTVELSLFGETTVSDFGSLDFGGSKKSPYRQAWNEMDRIAKLISPNVSYLKK